MRRFGSSLAVLVASCSLASAQQAGYGISPFGGAPQFGGVGFQQSPQFRQNQPLSPYLNLFLGRNVGVNYFNGGVRSGTNAFGPSNNQLFNGNRTTTFFPQVGSLDQIESENEPPSRYASPTGHAAGFGNTLGYFGGQGPANSAANRRPGTARPTGQGNRPRR